MRNVLGKAIFLDVCSNSLSDIHTKIVNSLAKQNVTLWCDFLWVTVAFEMLLKKSTTLYNRAKLLYSVLKTLDQSIKEISEVYESDKNQKELRGFLVRFDNNDTSLIDLTGEATNPKRFSRGTFEGIKVAKFISDIKAGRSHNLFFIDEQMAYSHVEIETSILNAMVQFLGEFCQLFFTTHNYEVLDMNLPVHSYLFLSRQDESVKVVNPEHVFNKNDRSLLNAIRNNVFKTIPETDLIDSLLFKICDDSN